MLENCRGHFNMEVSSKDEVNWKVSMKVKLIDSLIIIICNEFLQYVFKRKIIASQVVIFR